MTRRRDAQPRGHFFAARCTFATARLVETAALRNFNRPYVSSGSFASDQSRQRLPRMSTSPPKGDKTADVSSGPLGGTSGRKQVQHLRSGEVRSVLNDLVCAYQERLGYRKAERFCSDQVNDDV